MSPAAVRAVLPQSMPIREWLPLEIGGRSFEVMVKWDAARSRSFLWMRRPITLNVRTTAGEVIHSRPGFITCRETVAGDWIEAR